MAALIRIKNLELRIKLFISLILIALFFILTPTAFAQVSTPSALPATNPNPYTLNPVPSYVSPTSPLYTDLLVNNMFHSFSCLAIGQSIIGQPCLTYQLTQNAQGMIQGIPVLSQTNLSGGALGSVTSVIGMLYTNPPVRTADYLASVGSGLGIVKEAKAQVGGSGAAVLNPILKLWQVSRNISYVILILIFLVIGLMIMFRNKINPQTVITAQTALPGLVIGLVMITFSYFFAGLISDFAFIGTNLAGFYFSTAQGNSAQDLVKDLNSQNVLSVFSNFIGIVTRDNATDLISSIWNGFNPDTQRFLTLISSVVVSQMTSPIGSVFGPIGQLVTGLMSALFTIVTPQNTIGFMLWGIATLILLYSMFRLLLRLLNNYITIIFLTLTAPFQFLAAALPGRQGIATGWMLNMLANILAFPAVIAVLYFVAFIVGPTVVNRQNLNPPFRISSLNQPKDSGIVTDVYAQGNAGVVGKDTFPLFGNLDLNFINLLLAFGALIALPSIPDIIGRTIGRLGVAGQLIGQEIGGSVGTGRGYFGQASRAPGALAQQVGPLTNQPGWEYIPGAPDPATGVMSKPYWKRSYEKMTGARPGLGAQIKGYFRK